MNKKAQGLSLNMVIVAAIALVVLVVIVLIFTGRLNIFAGTVGDCTAKANQQCKPGATCDASAGETKTTDKCPAGNVCCLKVGG